MVVPSSHVHIVRNSQIHESKEIDEPFDTIINEIERENRWKQCTKPCLNREKNKTTEPETFEKFKYDHICLNEKCNQYRGND